MSKNAQTTAQTALISHPSKVMLKILQARLQQYVNCELPDVQAIFRKGRGTRDQISNIRWIIQKVREFQKASALLTMPKPLTVWITAKCGKFFFFFFNSSRDGNIRAPDLPLEQSVCRSRSSSYNWTWNNRLVPNRERSMSRLYVVTLLI